MDLDQIAAVGFALVKEDLCLHGLVEDKEDKEELTTLPARDFALQLP